MSCQRENQLMFDKHVTSSTFQNLSNIIESKLVSHANSLRYNLDTNIVEEFNSIVVMTTAGKRVNYSNGSGWCRRYETAVLQWNEVNAIAYYQKQVYGKEPNEKMQKLEKRTESKRQWTRLNRAQEKEKRKEKLALSLQKRQTESEPAVNKRQILCKGVVNEALLKKQHQNEHVQLKMPFPHPHQRLQHRHPSQLLLIQQPKFITLLKCHRTATHPTLKMYCMLQNTHV